jgi:hypothetical protein
MAAQGGADEIWVSQCRRGRPLFMLIYSIELFLNRVEWRLKACRSGDLKKLVGE